LIAQSILSKDAGTVTLDRSVACPLNRPAYGGFMYFRELPQGIEECTMNRNRPAYFLDTEDVVVPQSLTGDERSEVVEVVLTVDVVVAGIYQVYGALLGGPDGTQLVASRPSHLTQNVFSSSLISGLPGEYKVTLSFSGEALARSNVPQPYWIDAAIVSDGGISDIIHRQLPPISLEGLGELAVRLGRTAGAELRRQPGQGTVLRVSVPVEVRNAGSYAVAATLSSGGRTVAESGSYRKLSPGQEILAVDFPGEELARQGLEATYTVTIEVHALDSETGAPMGVVDTVTQEISVNITQN